MLPPIGPPADLTPVAGRSFTGRSEFLLQALENGLQALQRAMLGHVHGIDVHAQILGHLLRSPFLERDLLEDLQRTLVSPRVAPQVTRSAKFKPGQVS